MTHKVESKVIGTLTQSKDFSDWWVSQPLKVPLLGTSSLRITFKDFVPEADSGFIEEADAALREFLEKGDEERHAISMLVYKNCTDFLSEVDYDEVDQPLHEIKEATEIWRFVQPGDIYVERRHRRDKDIYICITCECSWEQEHGLQLVYRKGRKLTRVSEQDGHLTEADAYDKPDNQDELLSQY